jgi:hypothetical protein
MYMGVDHADVGTLVVGMGPCPICREWHCLSCYSENDLGRHCDYDGWHFTVDALKPLTRAAREMLELVK